MWKRWSIKSLTGETAIEAKAKQQTSVTIEPSAQESLGIGLKGQNADGTIQEAALDPQEEMDKGQVIPIQLPTPKNSAEDTIKQPIAPVSSTETSSAEALGSVALDTHVPPGVTTLPFPTPHTDTAEPLTPTLKSPVSAGDTSADIPGNVVDTHVFSNTLSASGPKLPSLPTRGRRLSFRSLAFFYGRDKQPLSIPELPTQEQSKRSIQRTKLSRSQKEALSSAITLRTLMMGLGSSKPSSTATSILHLGENFSRHFNHTSSSPLPNLKKVKAQLLKPESAIAVISYLRCLPLPDGPSFHLPGRASSESLVTHPDTGGGPIHAVCLACTDEEAEKTHFSRLRTGHTLSPTSPDLLSAPSSSSPPNIATASLESLIPVLRDLRLVSLLTSPDLGFGQPVGDEKDIGIFTGSIPSAAVLVEGFEEITTQLMSLGFATSKAIAPSHEGIYPPEDRMSFLTYWWGLELVLPEPSLQYLGKVKSISNTLLNFLSALALFNNGVREALPFIRYIANFVDFEWSAIKSQDKGRGVVCVATWVMPAAMVPRPWDFPSRPTTSPIAPASPSVPETSTDNADKATEGTNAPQPPPERPGSSDIIPTMPLMPQLVVTPATLPRNSPATHQAGV